MRIPLALINPGRAITALPSYVPGPRNVGATVNRSDTRRAFADVEGVPSMKLKARKSGGVVTEIVFQSKYAELMNDDDLADFRREVEAMQSGAERLSRGGLSTRSLQQMGHPYGKGRRKGLGKLRGSGRGVSNLAVVNSQSGDFAKAWSTQIVPNKRGARAQLINADENAPPLAFGTKRMREHGPFTTVPAAALPRLRAAWRKAARSAWARENAMQQVSNGRANMYGGVV